MRQNGLVGSPAITVRVQTLTKDIIKSSYDALTQIAALSPKKAFIWSEGLTLAA